MINVLVHRSDAVELEEVRIHEASLRFRHPFVTSRGTLRERSSLVVELRGSAGGVDVTGWGQASPLPGWGNERLRDTRFDLGRLRDAVDAMAVTSGREAMRMVRPPSARFAVESALLDMVAQAGNVPLRRLLNPTARNSVGLNATLGILPTREATQTAVEQVAAGFETLKLKVGDAHDIERVTAVRAAVPEGIKLRLDANGVWNREEALHRIDSFLPLDIELIEQPVAHPDVLLAVAAESQIPIAADESCVDLEVANTLVTSGKLAALVLKPALLGAWRDVARIIEAAKHHDVSVIFTSAMDSAIGRWAVAQLAAAWIGDDIACGLNTGPFLTGDVEISEVVRAGRLFLGSGAGIGFRPRLSTEHQK